MDDSNETEWTRMYEALGRLLVQANYLEEAVVDLFWLVSGKSEADFIARIQGDMLGKIMNDMLAEYRRQVDDPVLLQSLGTFEPDLRTAVDKRNEFIHASWARIVRAGIVDGFQRTRRPRKGAAREEFVDMKIEDVEAATEIIGRAAEWLWWELFDETGTALRSAARK